MADAAYVVLYGLVAAISPTVLLATLVVLGSGRGRLNGIVFLAAFVAGQTLAFLLALLLGSAFTPGEELAGTLTATLQVLAGVALVAISWRRRAGPDAAGGSPRSAALFARLSRVRPAVSFGLGMPLGVGVKRLVITVLAAATVAGADLGRDSTVTLSVAYVVVATVVVWCPVLIYLVLGPRADRRLEDARAWITANERPLLVWTALALGLFLAADGLRQLA
jgi:Sap, sulfolipid-1-addressing protein